MFYFVGFHSIFEGYTFYFILYIYILINMVFYIIYLSIRNSLSLLYLLIYLSVSDVYLCLHVFSLVNFTKYFLCIYSLSAIMWSRSNGTVIYTFINIFMYICNWKFVQVFIYYFVNSFTHYLFIWYQCISNLINIPL